MTRSEARTPEAWRDFDRAALFVALAGLLALLLLWWSGRGPSQASCCAAPVVAAPAAPTAPTPTPPPAQVATPAPEPPKVEPAKAEPPLVAAAASAPTKAAPAADCGKIVEGVSVQFAFGSAALSAESRVMLDQAQLCVSGGRYEVVGHADNVGDKALNQRLSEARADAVVAYLHSKGVDAVRLTTRGYGETKPIADNSTEAGRAQNRRVTLMRLPL